MLLISVISVVIVAGVGLLGETAMNKAAMAEYREERSHERQMLRATERGWRVLDSAVTRRLGAHASIVVLRATKHFDVPLTDALTGEGVSPRAADAFLATIAAEFERYPEALLRRSGLRYVLLCSDLRQSNAPIVSLPNFESTLLLDVGSKPDFARRLVHHEFFHFVDFADDQQLKQDAAWASLNDRFFSYGSGGRYERDPGAAHFGSGGPGFASKYGRAALEEDKAEIFSFLMAEPERTLALAQRDPVVAAKVAALQSQLVGFAGDEARALLPR